MQILPATTTLPERALRTSHSPNEEAYPRFRPCLRWDFGFSCAFCFVHEADLSQHGVEGTGLTWVEHLAPQSTSPEKADLYVNCRYSCRFCNQARSATPIRGRDGGRLLDPCRSAWAAHFEIIHGAMSPKAGDRDAEYTSAAYCLHDPRKTTVRLSRQEAIEVALECLRGDSALEARLLSKAQSASGALRSTLIDAAERLRQHQTQARRSLERYGVFPRDATACSCRAENVLPTWLKAQVIHLED